MPSLVLPRSFLLIYQPKVRFVDERGGLQRVARIFSSHAPLGHAMQLGINLQATSQRVISCDEGVMVLTPLPWRMKNLWSAMIVLWRKFRLPK